MLLFFRFFISAVATFLVFSGTSVFAAVGFQSYTPAAKIYLTGSNNQVHFDVAEALYDAASPISAPLLDTNTRTFSGTFYLSGAGWVLMNTGSYSIYLDCGAQPIAGLTSNCTLSGTAWSETIGDVIFDRRAQYLPTTGTLSGKITTYIGDISLSGVSLPLLPASFGSATYTLMADHATHFDIVHPEIYESTGGLWSSTFSPIGIPGLTRIYSTKSMNADLSLAYMYSLEITDPNGSISRYVYNIKNNLPATALVSGNLIESFCTSASADARCPLSPMSFEYTVSGIPGYTTVADGQSYVDAYMKFRDRYGNRIVGGNVTIEYDTPTKQVQVSLAETSHFGYSPDGDAIVVPAGGEFVNFLDGTTSTPYPISLIGQDINYSFASYAPGTIQLKSLKYNGIDAGIVSPNIEFTPWYTVDALSASDIRIGEESMFAGNVSTHSARTDAVPMVIHGISIGDGAYATFADFTSTPMPDCQANQKNMSSYQNACDWSSMDGKYFPAIYARTLDPAGESYSFSGKYSPIIDLPYIPPEPVISSDYISYSVDGRTILYPSMSNPSSLGTSLFQNLRIRILGQSQETNWYNGIAGTYQTRVDFLNTIRKNITLLSRNRTDYSQADYSYTGVAQHITNSSFDTKRTIIVEGEDIFIDDNIDLHDGSLALIALKNQRTGIGGKIHIASNVTDVHATLIAENYIESSGDNQLYIYGSIVSNNTIGGASKSPVECPYFVATCDLAKAKLYDLEYFRNPYLDLTDKTGHTASSTTAQHYPDVSMIIEYDSRVQQDPPPGLKQ